MNDEEALSDRIARRRSAAAQVRIRRIPGGSSSLGAVSNQGALYIVTEQSIHVVRLADSIDPDRTNINIRPTQQKFLSRGAASPIIYKTFLTAEVLTKPNTLPKDIAEKIVSNSLDAAKNLSAMLDQLDCVVESEIAAVQDLKESIAEDSLEEPNFPGVEALSYSFIQRSDHCLRSLHAIVRLLYPQWNAKGYFEGFCDYIKNAEKDNDFAEYLSNNLDFIKSLREARNCVEHPKSDRKLIIKNYHLKPSGEVSVPTIEIVHPIYDQVEIGIARYMDAVIASISDIFESMLALMFDKKAGGLGQIKFRVVEVPEEKRRYGTVRYDLTIHSLSLPA